MVVRNMNVIAIHCTCKFFVPLVASISRFIDLHPPQLLAFKSFISFSSLVSQVLRLTEVFSLKSRKLNLLGVVDKLQDSLSIYVHWLYVRLCKFWKAADVEMLHISQMPADLHISCRQCTFRLITFEVVWGRSFSEVKNREEDIIIVLFCTYTSSVFVSIPYKFQWN